MDNNLQYVMGDFEGYFYTLQKNALTHGEKTPSGGLHNVNLYKGELTNVKSIDSFKPEDHLNRDGLFLHNITNIQLNPGGSSPLTEKKIYDFDQIVLKNVEVINSWELNDKTYGTLKGQLVGKIKKLSSVTSPPDPTKPTIPPPVGGGIKTPPPSDGSDEGWQRYIPPIIPGDRGRGCLPWIWDLLKWLLLLLFILLLLRQCKSCNNVHETPPVELDSSCYKMNDSLNREIQKLKETILLNEKLCEKRLEQEKLQNELDNLSSQIFFNGGTTEIRKYSVDEIDNIVAILKKSPSLKLEIQGFYNGTGNKTNQNLDMERANEVKKLMIQKGIEENRLTTVGLGNSKPLVPQDYYEKDPFGNRYNRNMRVEIKIVKY
jgi:outer membrane protein OmpA-like peptidoglycan-associated protein